MYTADFQTPLPPPNQSSIDASVGRIVMLDDGRRLSFDIVAAFSSW